MGKYMCKHVWGSCEFIYHKKRGEKQRGDTCGAEAMKRYDGKYFCCYHTPKKLALLKKRHIELMAKSMPKREERFKMFQERYGVENSAKVTECAGQWQALVH